jgi:hypothetical protein
MITRISIDLLLRKKVELFDKGSLEFSLEAYLGHLPNKITAKTFFLSMFTLLSNDGEE